MFMSNESVFLPAAVRDRIWDLLKERKVTQAELAARIGCSESFAEPLHQRQDGQAGRRKYHPHRKSL